MKKELKIILGLTSGTLKQLENTINELTESYFKVELEYNYKEEGEIVFSLYAEKIILHDNDLKVGIDAINNILKQEQTQGEKLLHFTLFNDDNKAIFKYHYMNENNDIYKVEILDIIMGGKL